MITSASYTASHWNENYKCYFGRESGVRGFYFQFMFFYIIWGIFNLCLSSFHIFYILMGGSGKMAYVWMALALAHSWCSLNSSSLSAIVTPSNWANGLQTQSIQRLLQTLLSAPLASFSQIIPLHLSFFKMTSQGLVDLESCGKVETTCSLPKTAWDAVSNLVPLCRRRLLSLGLADRKLPQTAM